MLLAPYHSIQSIFFGGDLVFQIKVEEVEIEVKGLRKVKVEG